MADIVEDPGSDVWGVVYRLIEPHDNENLDRLEGIGRAYRREKIVVDVHEQDRGNADASLEVEAYVVINKDFPEYPTTVGYICTIVSGAHAWKLPDDYIDRLERLPVETEATAAI